MTKDEIREVLVIYREELNRRGFSGCEFSHQETLCFEFHALQHVFDMIDKIEEFLEEDRIEKAFRWLGFMQGCLWSFGIYTLEDLRDHNRPSE